MAFIFSKNNSRHLDRENELACGFLLFKLINDTYGHTEGDRVLAKFAHAITHSIRQSTDRAYRLGGDEFAILFLHRYDQAQDIKQKVSQLKSMSHTFLHQYRAGLSIGLATLESDESGQQLIHRANKLMYQHKRADKRASV